MKLHALTIQGFQSFDFSGEIIFDDRINIIVGENNSGKSSILRSMQPDLLDDRHRNERLFEDFRPPTPQIKLSISVSGEELRDEILQTGEHRIPMEYGEPTEIFLERFFSKEEIIFEIINVPKRPFYSNLYPSHSLFKNEKAKQAASVLVKAESGKIKASSVFSNNSSDSFPQVVDSIYRRKMFYFTAERYGISEHIHAHEDRLASDASNLPAVLHTLAGNRGTIFSKLIDHLREIFSTVGNLSIRPIKNKNNMVEIRIWPTHYMNNPELSFGLKNCGNGVAQVLAILTAIMTIDQAIIVIDEINNFLHPAAVKKLLQIINSDYNHHQYIISTHSPEVISFGNPTTVTLTKKNGYNSYIKQLSMDSVEDFRNVADTLGVSMADVFAAERVIWVEGPTEELCFNYIYREFFGILPKGLLILSVANTGDFNSNRRDPEIVYDVYRRLTEASKSLIVKSIFSFDSEKLSTIKKNSMIKDSGGLLVFLPRRHLECYLIHPQAIAAFINIRRSNSVSKITHHDVECELKKLGSDPKFSDLKNWSKDIYDRSWLESVDAAKIINLACGNLSNQEVTFNKKYDSLEILIFILKDKDDFFEELKAYVFELINKVSVN